VYVRRIIFREEGGKMSNIIISKEAINDILTGHADYIKQKKMK